MDNNNEIQENSNPENLSAHSDSTSSPAEPPFEKPDPEKLRALYGLTQTIRNKFVTYHSGMARPGATTTYKENDGTEVTRTLTPRETMRHMKELHKYSKLALVQQKIDAALEDDDTKPKSLNELLTPPVESAGERMHQEAMAQGLSCAAELPAERVDQILQEEEEKDRAAHPPQAEPGRKKPCAIPPHLRNDWFVPAETQIEIMTRLADMALPDGREYHEIRPYERLMASTMASRFCTLTAEQQLWDMRLRKKKRDVDWDELGEEAERLEAQSLKFHHQQEQEFYKTHPRGGRGRPGPRNTEVGC
jgi:hypothetical protein